MSDPGARVFVYGLLRPGSSLHHVVEPYARSRVPAAVRGRLYDAGVPAARFDEDGEIEGFVLDLDGLDDALRILDDLEDEGTDYRRVVVEARTPEGAAAAWAYEYLHSVDGLRDVGRSWPSSR